MSATLWAMSTRPDLPPALPPLPHPLDHVAIAAHSLEEGSLPYLALGLTPEGEDELVESQGVRVRAFRVGGSLIELLEAVRPDSPVAAFLTKRGPGLHHIALRVQGLDAEMERLRGLGARFLSEQPRPGQIGRASCRERVCSTV